MEIDSMISMYLGIALMAFYLITSKINNQKLIIDHVTCIFFGFIYYVYLPIIIISKSLAGGRNYGFKNEATDLALSLVTNSQFKSFFLIFLGIIITVIIADLRSKNNKYMPTKFGTPDLIVMKFFLIALTILVIPAVYQILPSVLNTYNTDNWVRGSRGPFLSYIVVLITLSSMYLIKKNKLELFNVFTIFAFVFSLLNLLTGNRGFIITLIISILLVISQLRGGVKLRSLIMLAFFGIIASGIVGQLRAGGYIDYSPEPLWIIGLYHFMAEGNNVATSMLYYIAGFRFGHIIEAIQPTGLFEYPSSWLSQFISIIPSIVFPSKFNYIYTDIRATYFMSSSHFYPIMMLNFGLVGSYIFMYFFTYALNVVKIKYRFVGIYPALCAHIPFMFFRDFDMTTVKFMFAFTFLFAIIILLFGNTLRKILRTP